jgi:tetratricopeptide (TPR) repeat protein
MSSGSWLSLWWLRKQAGLALVLGLRRRALDLYRQVLAADGSDAETRATVGTMLMESGDPSGAAAEFTALLAHQPDNAEGWFNLGYIQEHCENLGEAERCFRRAIELRPQIDRAWYGLALVLIRTGRLSEAVAALKENTRLQPFSPFGWYQLGMTHHHLGEAEAARKVHEHLKSFEPRYAATLKRDIERTPARGRDAQPDHPSPVSVSSHPQEALHPTV